MISFPSLELLELIISIESDNLYYPKTLNYMHAHKQRRVASYILVYYYNTS